MFVFFIVSSLFHFRNWRSWLMIVSSLIVVGVDFFFLSWEYDKLFTMLHTTFFSLHNFVAYKNGINRHLDERFIVTLLYFAYTKLNSVQQISHFGCNYLLHWIEIMVWWWWWPCTNLLPEISLILMALRAMVLAEGIQQQ